MKSKSEIFNKAIKFVRPLFIFLTFIAIFGFLIQLIFPNLYFSNQEELQMWVSKFTPYDGIAFIFLQIIQVVIAPISHYAVSILGGFIYGPYLGGVYNWIGRMIGHIIAYWLGRTIGQKVIVFLFNKNDFERYKRFIQGTKDTFFIRLTILFLMIYLPFFPDDELSYLVGLGGLSFPFYLAVLFFGHIGGSFSLAYIGAGIETKDPYFWLLTIAALSCAILLIFYARKFSKKIKSQK